MKAQGSIELILIITFITGFMLLVVIPWFSEAEYSLALSAARVSAHEFAVQHDLELKQLEFSESGNTVTITPRFSPAIDPSLEEALRRKVYAGISQVFYSLTSAPEDACLQGPTRSYCVIA